jgi:hypothetical protein
MAWTSVTAVLGSRSLREQPSPDPGRPRIWSGCIAVLVAVVSLVALVVVAGSSIRQTERTSTSRQTAAWNLDDRYWTCLETQARSLVQPEEHVWIDPSVGLSRYVNLEFVLAPFVVIVPDRSQATAWLTLRTGHGSGTCLNWEVVGRFDGPGGSHTVVRRGTGASLSSKQPLPTTPL